MGAPQTGCLKVQIKKMDQEVKVWGIHLVCFGCGMYSHVKETCHSEILATTIPTVQELQIRDDEGRESDRIITGDTKGGDEVINPSIV